MKDKELIYEIKLCISNELDKQIYDLKQKIDSLERDIAKKLKRGIRPNDKQLIKLFGYKKGFNKKIENYNKLKKLNEIDGTYFNGKGENNENH